MYNDGTKWRKRYNTGDTIIKKDLFKIMAHHHNHFNQRLISSKKMKASCKNTMPLPEKPKIQNLNL